ncbi:DUF1993 family protein [Alteromonas sediminis]|uniref:DUF1993 family protein n=1 Tax=Alteromonas sediminis TaxID=2259342 RepID=UPI001404892D|nr:DUF1993 domain-containing protein [Alteromonas sediminis]
MLTLFELTVPNYLRVINATIKVMEKGAEYLQGKGVDLDEIVTMQLADDMQPFSFQVTIVYHQAVNGMKGLLEGEFSPPQPVEKMSYSELIDYLKTGVTELSGFSEGQINARSNQPMYFKYADKSIPFTTENFVLAFTYPNLYFHATTIYDMLRMKGVPLGKPDFMGRLPIGLPE